MTDRAEPGHYWAFISYSHADRRWAEWLQRSLETYAIPKALVGKHSTLGPIPKRLFPIFRDEAELSSAPSLGSTIDSALRGSRTLVVVCSPAARTSTWVDREIEDFAKLGRADRIFALLVDREPDEAFPQQLIAACGDPLAADVRAGTAAAKRAALLRLVAGIFGLSFDDLVHRDDTRRQRRRIFAASVALAASVAASVGYVGLADARLDVPGAPAIRYALDAHDLSVFRHVPSDGDLRTSMLRTDGRLLKLLDDDGKETGFDYRSPYAPKGVRDQWAASQAAAGTFVGGFATDTEATDQLRTLERGFAPGVYVSKDGRPYGWLANSLDSTGYSPQTSAEGVAWTILALTEALHVGRFGGRTRTRLLHDREIAIVMLRWYGQNADGSWNERPDLIGRNPATYTSVMVYQALIASREAGLPWIGSIAARDRALTNVRAFLLRAFRRGSVKGWLPDAGTGYNGTRFEGLDFQIIANLYRDERDGGAPVPNAILSYSDSLAPPLVQRPYAASSAPSLTTDRFVDFTGARTTQTHPVNFLWYPWALAFSAERYAHERRTSGVSHVEIVEARRILANLGVTDGAQLVMDGDTAAQSWVAAECAYGFGEALEAGGASSTPQT